jgi:hypothetical protein
MFFAVLTNTSELISYKLIIRDYNSTKYGAGISGQSKVANTFQVIKMIEEKRVNIREVILNKTNSVVDDSVEYL